MFPRGRINAEGQKPRGEICNRRVKENVKNDERQLLSDCSRAAWVMFECMLVMLGVGG